MKNLSHNSYTFLVISHLNINDFKMKKFILTFLCALSLNASAQIEPSAFYEGGDLYFVPSHLTAKGIAFLYSYRDDVETGKSWFTVFDENVSIVKQVEIEPEVLNFQSKLVTLKRRYLRKDGGTRTSFSNDSDEGVFLDDWTIASEKKEDKTERNYIAECPEVYEDNNSYHSRCMYLSQTLFNNDEEFEFVRTHYEVMPTTYCAEEDPENNTLSYFPYQIGGEWCHEYTNEGYDSDLGGYVITLIRYKYYGGLKATGLDIVSLDGVVKNTILGITDLASVVAIKGNYYVSAYDFKSSKYALYKIASAATSVSRVADISSETKSNVTYSLSGMRVKPNTKGIVIRNGQRILNK